MQIDICEHQHIKVCFHDTVEELHKATPFEVKDYDGCYVGHDPPDSCLGTIHLSLSCIGAGYVAHELQHALIDWACENKLTMYDDYEDISRMAGKLTADFWRQGQVNE
jgi:hypothetical protein